MKKTLFSIAIALLAASCAPKLAFYNEAPYRTMQGKIMEVTETTYPATKQGKKNVLNKKLYQKFAYTYNKQGQLLTSSYTNHSNLNTSSTFAYSKGDLVKRVTTLAPKNGKKTTQTYERIKHSKKEDIYIEYSNNNQLVDTITAIYDYDIQHVTLSKKSSKGKTTKSTITFANYRKQQTEQYASNNKIEFSQLFEYNDKQLLTNEISKQGNNPQNNIKTQYTKYDEHHNWTECEIYVNGELQSVTQREIVYK